jgi:N-methylhydantoinase B
MLDASADFRDRVCSSWNVSSNCNNLFGLSPEGRRVGALLSDHRAGGAAARSFDDGFSHAGQITSYASTLGNVEGAEWKLPLLYVYRKRLTDSGGPGRFRGGLTAAAAVVPYRTRELILRSTNTAGTEQSNAHGIDGGYPGAGSQVTLVRGSDVWALLRQGRVPGDHDGFGGEVTHLPSKAADVLGPDDVMVFYAPGGGGYGDPVEREPDRVARDVADGRVSALRARDIYGVALAADGTADAAGTEAQRAAIRARRRGGAIGPWRREDRYHHPDRASGKDWPVGDAVSLSAADGETLRCARCGHALTGDGGSVAVRHVPLAAAGPHFALRWAGESPHFALEEVACAGCGTLVDAGEVRRDG